MENKIRIWILTISDRASTGVYADRSGPMIRQLCEEHFKRHEREISITQKVIPDDKLRISDIVSTSVSDGSDIIFTTGGTGIGPRDVTIEAIRPMLDKEIPGIMEMIRVMYGAQKPNALLSRSVAGTIGKTLIYVLPGSEKAVKEYLEEILKSLDHALKMIQGIDDH